MFGFGPVHDPKKVCLGRKRVKRDKRTLRLANYLEPASLPTPPRFLNQSHDVGPWRMLANDRVGNCAIVGALHMNMLWSAVNGFPVPRYTDDEAIRLYSKLTGYVPGRPKTDKGSIMVDILNAWRKQAFEDVKIDAYVSVNPKDWEQVKIAMFLFGSLYMGVNMPKSAQKERTWSSISDPAGSWGGHCVIASGYEDRESLFRSRGLKCVTWGADKWMTPEWLFTYCDEMYAVVSPLWFDTKGFAPNGFNKTRLMEDLKKLK